MFYLVTSYRTGQYRILSLLTVYVHTVYSTALRSFQPCRGVKTITFFWTFLFQRIKAILIYLFFKIQL